MTIRVWDLINFIFYYFLRLIINDMFKCKCVAKGCAKGQRIFNNNACVLCEANIKSAFLALQQSIDINRRNETQRGDAKW